MSGPAARAAVAEPRILVLHDAPATSLAAAETIADALVAAVADRGVAHWSTTGGSTPQGIYSAITLTPGLQDRIPWDRVHVWWGDDRFVPRGHPSSNALPFDRFLLGTGPAIPPGNVHVMPMTEAIEAGRPASSVAAAYERDLRAAGMALDDAGLPILDVCLIGVGSDGHLFSAFPDSPIWDSGEWVSAVPAPTHIGPHLERVSLHPGIAAAARLPLVVVHGEGKAPIVATLLGPDRDVRRWPAQIVRRAGALWILDAAAAAGLPR